MTPGDAPQRPKTTLSPTALALPDAVRLLSGLGARHVSEDAVRRDADVGAPLNADGTLNVVHYAAWLTREALTKGGGDGD